MAEKKSSSTKDKNGWKETELDESDGVEDLTTSVQYPDVESNERMPVDQRKILLEKKELERLLEQTKRLQRQADMFLGRRETDESAKETTKELQGRKTADKLMTREGLTSYDETESNCHEEGHQVSPVEVVNPADYSCGFDETELAISSPENEQFSLRSNIRLLEENAQLLQKKIELEVLLEKARMLLEKTDLPQMGIPLEDYSYSLAAQTSKTQEAITRESSTREPITREPITREPITREPSTREPSTREPNTRCSKALTAADEKQSDSEESEENSGRLEQLYEKADEFTNMAKQLLEVMHENKDKNCNDKEPSQTVTDHERLKAESDTGISSYDLQTKEVVISLDDGSLTEAEPKPSVGPDKEEDDFNEDLELERLLQKAKSLLDKANRPHWSEDQEEFDTKIRDRTSLESKFSTKITTLDDVLSQSPLSDSAATSSAAEKQILTQTITKEADDIDWSVIQTTLLLEKKELDLLLAKTQIIQRQAELIFDRNQQEENKIANAPETGTERCTEKEETKHRQITNSDKPSGGTDTGNDSDDKMTNLDSRQAEALPSNAKDDTELTEEEDEDDDDDDPSFDAKSELRALLERTKALLAKANRPLSPTESSSPEEKVNTTSAIIGADKQRNSTSHADATSRTNIASREMAAPKDETAKKDLDLESLSSDAELELLLQKTKQLKQQADELIDKISHQDSETDPQASQKSERNEAEIETKLHAEATTKLEEQQTTKAKRPTEISLNNIESTLKETKHNTLKPTKTEAETKVSQSQLETEAETKVSQSQLETEDSQLELEEIEESQLEIQEIETTSQLEEEEEEYLSDGSTYYEKQGSSDDLEFDDKIPELTKGSESESSGIRFEKETLDDRNELQRLLQRTNLLMEKARLPIGTTTKNDDPLMNTEEILPEHNKSARSKTNLAEVRPEEHSSMESETKLNNSKQGESDPSVISFRNQEELSHKTTSDLSEKLLKLRNEVASLLQEDINLEDPCPADESNSSGNETTTHQTEISKPLKNGTTFCHSDPFKPAPEHARKSDTSCSGHSKLSSDHTQKRKKYRLRLCVIPLLCVHG